LEAAVASLASAGKDGSSPFGRFPNLVRNMNVGMDKTFLGKGEFPYDYIDSLEKLNETCLPPADKYR
jgi:hypothetical protein